MSNYLGLNEHHHQQAVNFMRFCRYKRSQRLKSVDHCFEDVKDSRLYEDTYTTDEVTEMLDGLLVMVRSEVESELLNSSHTSVLLMQQILTQAEKWHLKINADISQLENSELLEQIAAFEEREISNIPSSDLKTHKPRLEPLNETKSSGLLQMEIERLKEENSRISERAKSLENNVTSCMSENAALKKEISSLKVEPIVVKDSQSIEELEMEMSRLRSQLDASATSGQSQANSLTQDLSSTEHELLKVREQLELAEKDLDRKFKETAAYRNLRDILTKKNTQIKELRQTITKYEK